MYTAAHSAELFVGAQHRCARAWHDLSAAVIQAVGANP
jgi:hypothetical protein